MGKLVINPNNKRYYSEDFIKGFECGTTRQYDSDKVKIDKAIKEIKELYTEWENSTDDARLESNPFGAILNIIQINTGE